MKPLLIKVTLEEMTAFLNDPASRIVDSRMLETADFSYAFQILRLDNSIWELEVRANYLMHEDGTFTYLNNFHLEALDLFRLQYRNSPRMNPALYGLLDAADAESRVENTLPIQSR
ncbi:MAG TPA: hypothetical protein VN679_15135 [Candidatus Acidoferrales bacterium]|nr:hypothetical protein [Candidatus Acidoferrales bacterium]